MRVAVRAVAAKAATGRAVRRARRVRRPRHNQPNPRRGPPQWRGFAATASQWVPLRGLESRLAPPTTHPRGAVVIDSTDCRVVRFCCCRRSCQRDSLAARIATAAREGAAESKIATAPQQGSNASAIREKLASKPAFPCAPKIQPLCPSTRLDHLTSRPCEDTCHISPCRPYYESKGRCELRERRLAAARRPDQLRSWTYFCLG